GVLPVKQEQMDSLCEVFRKAPDPRDSNTQYRTGPVLTLIAMALLAGRREIAEIARFATTLTHPQRRRLGLPLKKGTRRFYKVPGYDVFYQILTRMDPEAFARILNDWLAARVGSLPQALALYDQKEGTERCEKTAAVDWRETHPALNGKIITADPLHCQRKTARLIVEKGGYF